jgi:uncharacterized protein YdiU (UPF0061 family)
MAGWNLTRFAETLLPLLHVDQEAAVKLAQDAISDFIELYHYNWLTGMRAKLGMFTEEAEDEALIDDLLLLMKKYGADYTNTFRALTLDKLWDMDVFRTTEFAQWNELWQARLSRQKESKASSQQLMQSSNPAIIPRNHRVEAALEAAAKQEDYSVMEGLLAALSNPYAYSPEQDEYTTLPEPSSCPYRTFCGT